MTITELTKNIKDISRLNDKRVFMVYQPILNVKTGSFDRLESLMRMQINGEMIYPDTFIPLIEKLGLIHKFSRIAVAKTCDDINKLIDKGYKDIRVSINFSFNELTNPDFIKDITDIIKSKGVDLSYLAFEFTETTTSEESTIEENLHKLKKENIDLYLDDFGKGYSNIDRLLSYPFDIIKIDKYITLETSNNPNDLSFVVKLTSALDKAGYGLLFEGIETEQIEKYCIDKGKASYLQGYYYSKPKKLTELIEVLEKLKE